MKKGRVRITNKIIADALGFPPDWEIEVIMPYEQRFDLSSSESEMIVSGSDFPETNNRGEAENCEIIVHEKARTFEIKKKKYLTNKLAPNEVIITSKSLSNKSINKLKKEWYKRYKGPFKALRTNIKERKKYEIMDTD